MTGLSPIDINGNQEHGPVIIAGPCSCETPRQTLETATRLAAAGVKIFRAGVWKPRTKPGGFEGVGSPGLQWLSQVKQLTGMRVATEVATAAHVKEAVGAGVDILWLGARTTANPFAVQEIALALQELGNPVPVLVKNPVNADLDLWIGALERLYNAGTRHMAAVHRGFSVYGDRLYRNRPQWHIPIELRRRLPQLQLFHDPSHVAGRSELVAALAQQALDMGFDGLMIESHIDPDNALSDSRQQLTPAELAQLLPSLAVPRHSPATETLNQLRRQIDDLDNELLEVLGKRMEVSRLIGRYKKEHRLPVFQVDRHDDIMRSRVDAAQRMGIDPDFMRRLLSAIHEESVRIQLNEKSRGQH